MKRRAFLQRLAAIAPAIRLVPLLDLSHVLLHVSNGGTSATMYETWRRNAAFLQGRQWLMRVTPISVADARRRWPAKRRYRSIILPT